MLHAPLGALKKIPAMLAARRSTQATATLTRPNNATQLAVKEAIGSQVLVFQGIAAKPGDSKILSSAILIDMALQPTKLSVDLLLFAKPLTVLPVDNALYTPSVADMTNLIARIKFDLSVAEEVGNAYSLYEVPVNQTVTLASDEVAAYGVLVARNTYTPVANETLIVKLSFTPSEQGL